MILEACYEATLWAAVLHALKHRDNRRGKIVFLTLVGGGFFGNDLSWVADAITMAIERVEAAQVGFIIRIVSPKLPVADEIHKLVERLKARTNN